MALRLKTGVTINGVQPETVLAIMVAETVFADRGVELTITSLTDGEHGPRSYHAPGFAFDCRIWAFRDNQDLLRILCDDLRRALGPEFDVVLEPTHVHIEFDLRRVNGEVTAKRQDVTVKVDPFPPLTGVMENAP